MYQYESGWKIGLLGAANAGIGTGLYCIDDFRGMSNEDVLEALLDEFGDDFPNYTLLD